MWRPGERPTAATGPENRTNDIASTCGVIPCGFPDFFDPASRASSRGTVVPEWVHPAHRVFRGGTRCRSADHRARKEVRSEARASTRLEDYARTGFDVYYRPITHTDARGRAFSSRDAASFSPRPRLKNAAEHFTGGKRPPGESLVPERRARSATMSPRGSGRTTPRGGRADGVSRGAWRSRTSVFPPRDGK